MPEKITLASKKQSVRSEIYVIRGQINEFIHTTHAIPRSVVDGTFSEVVAYKAVAETASSMYYVNNIPGEHHSLSGLEKVRSRLSIILSKLKGEITCQE